MKKLLKLTRIKQTDKKTPAQGSFNKPKIRQFHSISNKYLFTVSEAAVFLGVSADTLRNWEAKGKLIPTRTKGGSRRYHLKQLKEQLAFKSPFISQIIKDTPSLKSSEKSSLEPVVIKDIKEESKSFDTHKTQEIHNRKKNIDLLLTNTTLKITPPNSLVLTLPSGKKLIRSSFYGIAGVFLITSAITLSYLRNPIATKQFFASAHNPQSKLEVSADQVLGVSSTSDQQYNGVQKSIAAIFTPFDSLARDAVGVISPTISQNYNLNDPYSSQVPTQLATSQELRDSTHLILNRLDQLSDQHEISDATLSAILSELKDHANSTKSAAPLASLVKGTTFTDLIGKTIIDSSGNVYPQQSLASSLGTYTNRFYGLYLNRFEVTNGGDVKIYGKSVLGESTDDTVTFGGRLASDIIPSSSAQLSLGSANTTFKQGYIDSLNGTSLTYSNATLTSLNISSSAAISGGLALNNLSHSSGTSLCIDGSNQVVTCTVSGGSGGSTSSTLQDIYDNGNTLATTSGKNIDITLSSGLVTPTSFSLTNAGTANGLIINDTNGANNVALNIKSNGTSKLTIDETGSLVTSGSFVSTNPSSTAFVVGSLFNIDSSSSRVGIGTTSPTNTLSVNGSANITGVLTVGSCIGCSSNESAGWTQNGNLVALTDSSYQVGIGSTAVGTAKLAIFGGNVGIGTSSPSNPLSVIGNAGITGNLNIGGSSSISSLLSANSLSVSNAAQFNTLTSSGNINVGGSGIFSSTLVALAGLNVSSGSVILPSGSVSTSALTSSNVTVNAGTGLTGGGSVSLGNSITISAAQDIATSATPTFSSLNLTGNNAILSLTGTTPSISSGNRSFSIFAGNVGIGTSSTIGSQIAVNGNQTIGNSFIAGNAPANGLAVQGNVGIGTTTANYNLSVVGTGNFTGNLGIGGTATVSSLLSANSLSVTNGSFLNILTTTGNVGFGASASVGSLLSAGSLSVSGASILGSTLNVTGATSLSSATTTGNLGLGTASPNYRLDVNGGSSSTQIRFGNDSSNSGGFLTAISPSDVYLSQGASYNGSNFVARGTTSQQIELNGGANAIYFYQNNSLTDGATFSPTINMALVGGNLGVGTASPTRAKLQVFNASDIMFDHGTGGSNGGAAFRIGMNANQTFLGSNFYFNGSTKYARTGGSSYINFDTTTGSTAGDISFLTAPSGSADSALNHSTVVTFKQGGNVGIGTASPNAKFVVTGGNVGIGVSAAGSTLAVNGNAAFGFGTSTVTAPSNGLIVGGNVGIGTSTANFNLSVIGTGNFTGNLGIGGTATVSSLLSASSLNITNGAFFNTLSSTGNINIGGSGTFTSALVANGGLSVAGTSTLGSTSVSSLLSSGNVNIGASSTVGSVLVANGGLFVNGTSTLGSTSVTNLTSSGNVGLGASASVTSLLSAGSLSVTNGANFNTIYTSGNINVGGSVRASSVLTANAGLSVTAGSVSLPALSVANAALQGSGTLTVTAGSGLTGGGSVALGGSTSIALDTSNANNWTGIQTFTNGLLFPNGKITSDGNIGIGTTNPTNRLELLGNASITNALDSGTAGNATQIMTGNGTTKGLVIKGSATYRQTVLSDAPRVYYRFDESSGNALDSSGNNNTATVGSSVTYSAAGAIANDSNKAYQFTGTANGRVNTPSITTGTTFSIELWMKTTSASTYAVLWTQDNIQGLYYRGDSDKLDYYYGGDKLSSTSISRNTWHHIVISVSGGNGTYYVDGQPNGTFSGVGSVNLNRIGSNNIPEPYVGYIDEVAFYPTALTQTQVTNHYQVGSGVYGGTDQTANLQEFQNANGNVLSLFDANGNLGLGVTASNNKLTVGGSAIIGSAFSNAIAPTNGLALQGNLGIGTSTANFNLSVIGTGNFTGNLGIGGTATVSSLLSASSLNITNGSIFTGAITANSTLAVNSTFNVDGIFKVDTSTGNIGIGTTNPTSRLSILGGNVGIGTSGAGSTLAINGNGVIGFGTTSVTAPSNGLIVGGNVGIGTSITNSRLQLLTNYTSQLWGASSWSQSGLVSFTASQVNDGVTLQTAFHVDTSGVGSYLLLDTGAGNEREFTKLRILNTTPNTAIWDAQFSDDNSNFTTVYSSYNSGSSTDSFIEFNNFGKHRYWRLYKTNAAAGGGWVSEVQFYERPSLINALNDTGNVFTINHFGNIGLGTTNPLYKLSVVGTGNFTGNLGIGGTATVSSLLSASSLSVTTGSFLNTLTTTGNVGFGASANITSLLSAGSLSISNGAIFNGAITANSTLSLASTLTVGSLFKVDTATGNVGIGTTSPTSKLAVLGVDTTRNSVTTLATLTHKTPMGFSVDAGSSLTTGLVSYWRMDNTSGDETDSYGSNPLSKTGIVGSTSGVVGNSRIFVGGATANNYFSAGNPANLNNQGPRSVAFWIYPTATNSQQVYYPFSKNDGTTGWAVGYDGVFNVCNPGTAGDLYLLNNTTGVCPSSTLSLTPNTWNFVVMTWSGTYPGSGTVTFYLGKNGSVTSSTAASSQTFPDDSAKNVVIGARSDVRFEVAGNLDEIGFWNKVLSASEVSDLYNSGSGNGWTSNGIGSGLAFETQNNIGNLINTGKINSILTSVVAGQENSALTFSTTSLGSSGERLRLDSNGNLGLNNQGPQYRLDIADATANGRGINVLQTATSGTVFGLYSSVTGAASSNIAGYFNATGASTNYGLIVGSGNVGIGTSVPGSKLAITGGNVGIGVSTAGSTLAVNGNAAFGFGTTTVTAPTNGMIVNGNVGIGFTTPSYKLDVFGTTRAYDLIAHDITLSGGFATTLQAFTGLSGYINTSGGLGTGGTDNLLSAARLTNAGNLVNIGSIQAGETLLTSGGTFATKVDYTTGTTPVNIAAGDLNGDGKADIVAPNSGSTTVSVFLNNGNGTFANKVDYTVGTHPYGAAIGDLNGDGKADIVAANLDSTNISVLMNNSNGTFATRVNYTTCATSPFTPTIADINGDGKADITTLSLDSALLCIFINNGDGTFASVTSSSTSTVTYGSPAVADLNGDGKADVAAANPNAPNAVSVLLNNGNGTFATRVNYSSGSAPRNVAAGDLDNDGDKDLVSVNSSTNNISVFLNNGNGTFASKVDYTAGTGPYGVNLGDFNGDGKLDIAIGNTGTTTVAVFLNRGNGTFAPKVDYTVGTGPYQPAVADYNGDGKLDIAVGNSGSNSISVLLNNPTTLFYAQASTGNVGIGTSTPAANLHVAGVTAIFGSGEGGTPSDFTIRGAAASGTDVAGANMYFDASNGTGTGGSGSLIFRTAPASNSSPVFDTKTTQTTTSNTPSWSHTISSGSNRALILAHATDNSGTISSATWTASGQSAQALTLLVRNTKVEIWYLVAPNAGAGTINVTTGAGTNFEQYVASSWTNVSQNANPFRASNSSTPSGTTASVSVTSTVNDVVIDAVDQGANGTFTPDATQTTLVNTDFGGAHLGSSYKSGSASSTTMQWTVPNSTSYMVAGSLMAPAGTATDGFAERLKIDNTGRITIGGNYGTLAFTGTTPSITSGSSSFSIFAGGNVGIGTSNPTGTFTVQGSGTFPAFNVLSSGNIAIGTTENNNPLTIGTNNSNGNGAFLSAGGTWTNGSSREFKENFEVLDSQLILSKINSLSITSWNYKVEDSSIKHIGPIAEEFYETFGVGNDAKHISTIDPAGIALLGIQGLTQLNQKTTLDTLDLKDTVASLSARVARLENALPNSDLLDLHSPISSTASAALASLKIENDATVSGQLNAFQATISDTFKALGSVTLGSTLIAGDLTVDGTLSITNKSISAIDTLYLQDGLLAENIDMFNGKVKITKQGNLSVQSLGVSAKTLGTGTIRHGSVSVTINNAYVTPKSKIFITPHKPVAIGVTDVNSNSQSFKVEINQSQTNDIDFDWWIVEQTP